MGGIVSDACFETGSRSLPPVIADGRIAALTASLTRVAAAIRSDAAITVIRSDRDTVAVGAWRSDGSSEWRTAWRTLPELQPTEIDEMAPRDVLAAAMIALGMRRARGWRAGRGGAGSVIFGYEEGVTPSGDIAGSIAAAVHLLLADDGALRSATRDAVRNERTRIAAAIHEGPAQEIATVCVQLELLGHIVDRDVRRARELIGEIRARASASQDSLRRAMAEIGRTDPDGGWLEEVGRAVEDCSRTSGIEVAFAPPVNPPTLDGEIASFVVAFVREGLTNVRKHSAASTATVRVEHNGEGIRAVVGDDGTNLPPRRCIVPGHGLALMRARAKSLGGDVRFGRGRDRGAELRLEIPASAEAGLWGPR